MTFEELVDVVERIGASKRLYPSGAIVRALAMAMQSRPLPQEATIAKKIKDMIHRAGLKDFDDHWDFTDLDSPSSS